MKHQESMNVIKKRLIQLGVKVEEESVDIVEFESWLKKFPEIFAKYQHQGDVKIEKCLEHFLTFKFLQISSSDVFIDIAAAGSPFVDALNKKNIKSYRLDLAYPQGVNGVNIGGDASKTPLPDQFATTLALHCAYECFQGDADILLIKESERILKSKGAIGIIPLYIDEIYYNATSPFCNQAEISFDKGAKKIWRDDQYHVPFSRHYSPDAFYQRIYQSLSPKMKGKIIFFNNFISLMNHFKGQRIYCNFLFIATKG